MDKNEINKVAGVARNWVVPRINIFVPVRLMTGAFSMYLCAMSPRNEIKLRYIDPKVTQERRDNLPLFTN